MEVVVALVVVGVFIASLAETVRSRDAAQRREWARWAEMARACGLTPHERFPYLGYKGRLAVHVSADANDRDALVALVSGLDLPLGFRLRNEGLATAYARRIGVRELETGDPAFDDQFFVEGPELLVRTLLDAETRHLCLRQAGELDFTQDGLKLRIPRPTLTSLAAGREIGEQDVRTLVAIGERFLRPDDPHPRLCAVVRGDPQPGVRRRCVQTLVREFPEHELTRETLQAALTDAAPEVRLRAALALGEEGRPALMDLAAGAECPDACSAVAVQGLGEHLAPERARSLLEDSLRLWRPETARACLGVMGASRHPDMVPPLARVLAGQGGTLAVDAARALGAIGLPAAEAPLIDALDRHADEIRVAAAAALGQVGTAAAVLPLKEAAARHGGRDFVRAVRQAIAEIQERGGGSPGQLSLAGDEAGQLSLADTTAGQVSLADGEDAG